LGETKRKKGRGDYSPIKEKRKAGVLLIPRNKGGRGIGKTSVPLFEKKKSEQALQL